ncbi:MAG: Fpg/Nei family DNA glycosylase [Actinomycetota bacterium]
MPEGDTIHRAAARIRTSFGGDPLTAFAARTSGIVPGVAPPGPGDTVLSVEARGKHLLVRFGNGATLHTHLGMLGAWRVRTGGAPPELPRARTGVAMATARVGAVCRSAPVVELLDDASVRRHPVLRALGPDLCLPDVDLDTVIGRLASVDAATPVGAVLLDQRVAAGVGNVYRAEVLWACRVDPWTRLGTLSGEATRELYATAARLLQANLTIRGPRRTVPEGLAVYERAGRPCRRCGTSIRVASIGDPPRSAWWCPSCQTRR